MAVLGRWQVVSSRDILLLFTVVEGAFGSGPDSIATEQLTIPIDKPVRLVEVNVRQNVKSSTNLRYLSLWVLLS